MLSEEKDPLAFEFDVHRRCFVNGADLRVFKSGIEFLPGNGRPTAVMKNLMRLTASLLVGVMFSSCSTSYDSYGNRRQSIDPAGAAIGAVALGALAYSIGKDRGKKKEHRRHTKYDNYNYGHRGHGYGRGHYGSRYYR